MRRPIGDTTALAVGSVVSGLLAYLFFGLATRQLGAAGAAPLSVLWTYWTFAAAALSFPIQHWIAHTAAAHGSRSPVARVMRHLLLVVGGVTLTSGIIAWIFRDVLFHSEGVIYPLLVAAITIGAAFIGLVRGGLAASNRFGALAATLIGENGFRCVAAGALIGLGVENATVFGVVLAAGSFVGLIWPSAYLMKADESTQTASLRFLGGAAGGQLIGQAVLTSGPVVLAFVGGSAAAVTSLFAGLALFRAPYQMAIAVVAKLTGYLTTLHQHQSLDTLRRFRRSVWIGALLLTPLGALIGAALGPVLIPLVFGSEVTLSARLCALVAAGSTVALFNLVLNIMLMAQSRTAVIARCWTVAAAIGLAFAVLAWLEPVTRVCVGFVVAEVIACVTLASAERLTKSSQALTA